jgi:intracellular multiplication protein IcmN
MLFIVSFGLLDGCQLFRPAAIAEPRKLPTNVNDGSDMAISTMYKKLTNEGVQIKTIGQMYLISIPARLIFAEQSPKINWNSYEVLNDIACYLQLFRKITVHVNAFGSCYRSTNRTYALTLARAKAVGNYLWEQNIETRMVFTEGVGNDKPIVAELQCTDSSPNARIEIVFRQLVA